MRRLLSFLICVVASTAAFAQETNCSNGIDDDGNGLVDCYDPTCAGNTACQDFFIVDPDCQIEPPPAPAFTMTLDFASENETTNHFSRMAVGDLDRDGIPEIITMNKYTDQLIVLNGNDGSIKDQATIQNSASNSPEWEIAIANIDNDDCAEIFFLGTDRRIYVYDCDLNFLYNTIVMPGDPINFGLADFDGDGLVELYCKDMIFDAHSGRRLVSSTTNWNQVNGGPVAVNMGGTTNLELVIGLSIYQVNIPVGRGTDAGSLTLLNSRPEYFIRNVYNATSVADFNQDGFLDIIASGSTGCHGKNTTIFFWDVNANTLRTYSDHNSINNDNDYETGWQNGTGRVNIADLDGDGELNLSYVSGGFLYALREDMTRLWRVAINEETSGYTGCTLFDFNGDGQSEIVYRDEQYLYIIDGTDGSIFNQQNCVSRTNREYPIVADVDADGSTEICVTCGFDDALSLANFNTTSYSQFSHVRVFKSAAEPWVPARRVWNQHGYFVVNVNDDLSIPRQQTVHNTLFSTVACRPGDPVLPMRPLNKFLNQSPYIDSRGCPAYSAPDIDYLDDVITIVPPTCPDLDFTVSFDITNRGPVVFSGIIPVSFYTSNPMLPGADKLATVTFPVDTLRIGGVFSITNLAINSGGSDSLFIVLNDAGTTIPTPIVLPNTPIIECDYDNVLGIAISPNPVTVTALEVTPHENCAVPPTGSVRAFVLTGGVENTADYDFYWFDGPTSGPIANADFVGPIYTGIVDGPYQVYAIHKTASCSSDTTEVVVSASPGTLPTVTVTQVSPQTTCNPPNGSLQATVAGPGGNAGFTFDWEDIGGPIGISGATLANQQAGTYTVVVSRNGCQATADGTILDQTQEPDLVASATPVTDCIDLNSGTVTAEAFLSSNAQPDANYTFDWYFYDNVAGVRGSPLPALHGAAGTPDRSGLPIGFYEVEITEIATGCPGTTTEIVEVIDDRQLPEVEITELAPQTSCDPANPNGRFQALVSYSGVPQPAADFTFEWFEGQNTLPANAHTTVSGTNGDTAEEVKGGGLSYTVRVTSAFQCVSFTDTVITEIINVPLVTLTTNPNGICDAALASGNFTGEAIATVTFGGNPVALPDANYSFEWYNGTQAIGAPRPETTSTITQLDSGYYTVVVTRTDLGCESSPETEFVDNTTVLPVITADANASTNCDPALANGGVQVTDVDGLGIPATYDFEWHRGSTIAGYLVANAAVSRDTLQGAAGRFYTVLVTNTDDGCQNTETVEVPDDRELPLLSLTPTPNGVCNPALTNPATQFSGRVDATVTNQGANLIGDYEFTWTDDETGAQVFQATGAAGQALTNRDSSHYTAVVEQISTGCLSNPFTAQVIPAIILPVINADANASTNCDPALANGGVQVIDVDGAAPDATHTFEWHRGNTIAGYLVANAAVSADTLQGAPGRFYTVLVTDLSDGCQNTETVEVINDSELPLLSLTPTPNGVCNPALTNPATQFSGRVDATVTNQGANLIGDYEFTWTDEETGAQVFQATGGTGQALTNRDSSHYTAVVEQISTGCLSNPFTAQVIPTIILPVINADANASTNCDPALANGGVQVIDVDGAAPDATHTFEWHRGNTIAGYLVANAAVSADTLQGAPGRFYTVLVTDLSDGCQNTETVEVIDDSELPLITLTSTDNTICVGVPDGTASLATLSDRGVNIPSPFAGYTFAWETGATTFTLGSRVAGNYSLKVRSNTTGCESDSAAIDVGEDFFIPPIDIVPTTQTSCDITNLNGALAATIDETAIGGGAGATAGYTFAWEENGNPFSAPGTGAGATPAINNLSGNLFYTITVNRVATGCTNTESIFLPEIITYPIVAAAVSSNVTRCDNPDGAVVATVGGTDVGYTFFWMNEVGSNQTADDTTVVTNATTSFTDNGTYPNLIPGYYTVVARDDNTSCLSQPITRQVQDATVQTTIAITLGPTFPSTCGASDGEMSALVTGGSGGNVDFFWHLGGPVNDSINFFTNPPQFNAPDDIPFATLLNQALLPAGASSSINGLESRLYTLIIVDDGNGCGNYETIFLPFNDAHNITTNLTPSTLCPYTIGNGVIEVTVGNILPATNDFQDYTYVLYEGENPDPAFQIGGVAGPGAGTFDPQVYSALAPGMYTIEVRQDPGAFGSNCAVYEVVEIEAEAFAPVIDITATTANTACDVLTAADGEVEIEITNDVNEVSAVAFNYDITITPAPLGGAAFNTGPYPPATLPENITLTGFSPVTAVPEYTIRVENTATNCFSERFVAVPDQPVVAEIVDGTVNILPALFCDPALETIAMAEVTALSIIGGGPDNLDDYEFEWFTNAALTSSVLNADGVTGAAKGGEVLSNVGAPLPSSPITVGSYWVVATKEDVGTTGGVGCFSAPFRVDILDETINPSVEVTSTPNTACDANFEGAIQVEMTDAGSVAAADYTYTWTTVVTAIATPSISNGDGAGADDNFSALEDGLYVLQAENNSSGCITTGQVTITESATPIIVATATTVDQIICDPDGSITVVDILVGGVVDPAHGNFDFSWYRNDPNTPEIVPVAQGNDVLDIVDLPLTMGAGTYFVKAGRRAGVPLGSGCESAPLRVDIFDNSQDPTVQLTPTPNTACDANFEGAIQVEMTDAGSVAAADYTYTWTTVVTAIATPSISNGDGAGADDNFPALEDGLYVLQAENNSSGCITTGQTTITESAIPIIVATATTTDQLICNPDGSITVVDILVGGVADPVHGNFNFSWYRNDPNTPEIVPITAGNDVLDIVDLPLTIGAGTYFVKASRLTGIPFGSGCESAPLRVDLFDLSEDPDLDFTSQPNSSCNPANPNGVVLATASERDATTDTYTFAWTYNTGALPGVTTQTDISPTSQLGNAFEGDYVLEVTNTLTGCNYTEALVLDLDLTISLPNIVNVLTIDPVDCFATGSAQVVEITIGGTTTLTNPPDDLDTNFDYEWYRSSFPGGLLGGETNSTLANQFPDRYFVLVEDLSTNCTSSLVEVFIDSAQRVLPVIAIQQTTPQASCNAAFGTGTLVSTADGQDDSNANYSFTWFPSLNASGSSFANTSTITGLFSGDYSVEVTNALTNCSSTDFFLVASDSLNFLPQLLLSSNPLTECDTVDGAVFIRGLRFPAAANYPFAYSYTSDVYVGAPPADINTPEFPNTPNDPNNPGFLENFVQPNLLDGLYTVRLTDNNTGCIAIDTISVEDGRVFPVPVITEIAPVTNCDPLRPNGVARALVNGSFVGFSFEWFEGTVPAGAPLYVGAEFNQLLPDPTAYVVRATNLITGCSDSTVTRISSGTLAIPRPDIEVLSHVTSCITNNGALSASVGGNTFAYIFDWYDGTQEVPPPDFTGEIYNDLAIGMYSVTATSKTTGCKSPLETEEIISAPDFPEVDFEIKKALCGLNNGSVSLVITSDVAIQSIQWFDAPLPGGNQIAVGPNLSEVLAGSYSVIVTTVLGCATPKDVVIDTEIRPFNGISRASTPGENDYFHIDCIDNFPRNVVKIFNRAGTLVYEAEGYDNFTTYFDGKSNKGISPMGTDLPDGTYFYVIDKNNGSKAIAGYLEIVK